MKTQQTKYDPGTGSEYKRAHGFNIEANKAQHSPDNDEIVRLAGMQSARANKWQGWDWKAYQTSITRQNHHISRTELMLDCVKDERDDYKAHADKLAEAGESLKNAVSDLINEPRTLEIEHYAETALHEWQAAYEAAQ